MKFEIKDRDSAGRTCRLLTEHGTVSTPNLLPVVNPNKMLISPDEMRKLFGTEMIITNSYIINKKRDLKEKALDEGVHRLLDFDGAVMTDSGTFQSYVYGDINVDYLEIVEFQRDIGSDVGTILDVFGTPDQSKEQAEEGVKETLRRAKESIKVKGDMALACTVQGSIYSDLRKKCAKELSDIDTDFFTIGGLVPLMENQRYKDLLVNILEAKKGLNPAKPVHAFGAGHPLVFPLLVALGCDFFDSSAYAKYANDERMMFPWGTAKLENLKEIPCCCPICSNFSASELKKMDKKNVVLYLAKHNLYVSFAEIKKIRNVIAEGSLWELVERRARSNPYLLYALTTLRENNHKKWLEKFESASKNRALFYTGAQTIHRPIIFRYHKRLLNRYKSFCSTFIVFPEGEKPYSKYYSQDIKRILKKRKNVNILIKSSLGPSPIELDEMYPLAQSIFPEKIDSDTKKIVNKIFKEFTKDKDIIWWRGKETLEEIEPSKKFEMKEDFDIDSRRVSAVADMQFGKNAGKVLLLDNNIKIVKSKKTGKIRNIYMNGKHVLSMRASDGMFTLKIDGARILHKFFKYPRLRVTVNEDAALFVKEGKSVFAKFVKDCDPELRPLDECLIVNEEDCLLAVGRCMMNRLEMLSFNYGMAVKNREYCKNK